MRKNSVREKITFVEKNEREGKNKNFQNIFIFCIPYESLSSWITSEYIYYYLLRPLAVIPELLRH
jgi:hypothetical protein